MSRASVTKTRRASGAWTATGVALAILAGGSAVAGESAKPPVDQSVTLATVALPIVSDGRLVNYDFVSVKLLLTARADPIQLKTKEPFFRDALVRAAHRTPFTLPNDFNHLDQGKLKAAMLRDANQIAGPGQIAGVVVLSETAQKRLPSVRAQGAAIVP